jgi:dienelactone hydrolase
VRSGATTRARGAVTEVGPALRTAAFVLELMPTLPSGLLERLAPPPVHERVTFASAGGEAVDDVFRPRGGGRRAGIVLCLGVVPAALDHPQIPRLGSALARAGFVSLVHWAPAMQDRRLDPADAGGLVAAFEHLLGRPEVDPRRCGLVGACVGASFALIAAARPELRDRVAFVGAFAPYASAETLARAISSRTREGGAARRPWPVDTLTWQVFTRTLTEPLEPAARERLRAEYETPDGSGAPEPGADAEAVRRVLEGVPYESTEAALAALPAGLREQLRLISPIETIDELRAPLVSIGHDRYDLVVPVEESRRLRARLAGRPGVRYTEFGLFAHADPTARSLPLRRLVRELVRFTGFVHPLVRAGAQPTGPAGTASG